MLRAGDAERPMPMHGGASTGPRTPEGLARLRALNTRHGRYSREMVALRAAIRELRREARRIIDLVE